MYYEVCIDRVSTYSDVADPCRRVLKLLPEGEDSSLKLFRCDGTLVSEEMPTGTWSLREYLTLAGRQPSQVKFGVAYVAKVNFTL